MPKIAVLTLALTLLPLASALPDDMVPAADPTVRLCVDADGQGSVCVSLPAVTDQCDHGVDVPAYGCVHYPCNLRHCLGNIYISVSPTPSDALSDLLP